MSIYEPSNHNVFFSNKYSYKQERAITSYAQHLFEETYYRKCKFVNWKHGAVSYTDRFFGYGDICDWTRYQDDFFRRARNVSYPTE